LDEERGKVSETLRSHPALVPKGARIAGGNLLVREMTFFDLLDKYGKLVEGLQAPQKPSLDAVKPWAQPRCSSRTRSRLFGSREFVAYSGGARGEVACSGIGEP
jgi:hypothetical protein